MFLTEQLQEKWSPVLDTDGLPSIKGSYKRSVITKLLEAQEGDNRLQRHSNAMLMEDAPANSIGGGSDLGGIGKFDPILISLVRRALPNLMAFDVAGVQPLSGPTGIIFAMRSLYGSDRSVATRQEALFQEANSGFSGVGTQTGTNPTAAGYSYGTGMSTAAAEALGTAANPAFSEMSFTIEKTTVTAKTRALKAEYSIELAQDLKAIHGLDAEAELSNILSQEITFEMNRELIRRMYTVAKSGAQTTTTPGVFDLDVDANGRWSVERFKGLLFQMERDANLIAQDTRRGKGNFVICSADVASAMAMAGVLDTGLALQGATGLQVDDMGNTFAGMYRGMKVFVDPYSANFGATDQYYMVGYRGQSAWDSGIFYCPYVPLQMHRAVDPNSFQPKIAFKTRYGMISNPFVTTADTGVGAHVPDGELFTAGRNQYFRRSKVVNIL